jgi:hypothetical protein
MKKALIWITLGGLAVAGTAYLLIKQNKKKTGEVPVDNTSLKSNIAQGNSNSSATSSASTLTSNAGTSQASNAPAPPPPPLLTSQSTPQEIFDLVEAKKLSGEIDALTKEQSTLQKSVSALGGTWGTLSGVKVTTQQKMERLGKIGEIAKEIKAKTAQLTALGYAIQPYGGVKKI